MTDPEPSLLTNEEVARLLREIAAAYEVLGEPVFKIRAYQNAAASVEHATSAVKDLWEQGKLEELPGIGQAIAAYLEELFTTGEVRHFREVKEKLPKGMFVFLDIPGVGPKTAYKLARELKLQSIEELREALQQHRVCQLEGLGEKSEEQILAGIEEFDRRTRRMLLPRADEMAAEAIDFLKKIDGVVRADPLGSLRRRVATVGDVDIAVAVTKPSLASTVVKAFTTYPRVGEVIEKGKAKATVLWDNGKQLDLRVQELRSYGALLQHFTGSKAHNIHLRKFAREKGWSLSEYGIKEVGSQTLGSGSAARRVYTFRTEEEFYEFLGLQWIPPELREDMGEIEAAATGELPQLVRLDEIKGDLHVHCSFDLEESHDPGRSGMEEIIEKASRLGYEYVALGNHNPSVYNHTPREIIDLIKRKQEAIDVLQEANPQIKLLNQVEVDILADGKLAIPDEGLALLDVVVVSIHSAMRQPKEKLTRRVVGALRNPYTHILGHPTGRLLTQREGYELDWEEVFTVARENNKLLEINAFYNRLDLPDTLVREAVRNGVKLVVSTDAHHVNQMELMRYGVAVARRGWARCQDVVNSFSLEDLFRVLDRP